MSNDNTLALWKWHVSRQTDAGLVRETADFETEEEAREAARELEDVGSLLLIRRAPTV